MSHSRTQRFKLFFTSIMPHLGEDWSTQCQTMLYAWEAESHEDSECLKLVHHKAERRIMLDSEQKAPFGRRR